MNLRRLPPVHSPLSGSAVLAGFGATVSASAAERARAELQRWLTGSFTPEAMLLTDSGTSALRIALSLVAARGERVALPAWGCYDLATACDGAGVDVVLYDLDPRTLGPDWGSLRSALEGGARAVVVVHFFGLPVAISEASALAREVGAVVIEDAAQGVGGQLGSRPCGALGQELGILSFGRGKGITGGRGGALLGFGERWRGAIQEQGARQTPPAAGWVELPKAIMQHLLARPALYGIPAALPFLRLGETIYHLPQPSHSLSRAAAGLLSETTLLADSETMRRRANAARLLGAVGPGLRTVAPIAGAAPGYLRLPLLGEGLSARLGKDPVARALGIMPGYPGTLAELGGFLSRVRNGAAGFPGSRELAACLVTMPTHGLLSESDLGRLERWLHAAGAA